MHSMVVIREKYAIPVYPGKEVGLVYETEVPPHVM